MVVILYIHLILTINNSSWNNNITACDSIFGMEILIHKVEFLYKYI